MSAPGTPATDTVAAQLAGAREVVLGYGQEAVQAGTRAVSTRVSGASGGSGPRGSVQTYCDTPFEIAQLLPHGRRRGNASKLGDYAELLIVTDFCAQHTCAPYPDASTAMTDYFDGRIGGADKFLGFLAFHNPDLTHEQLAELSDSRVVKDALKRPDILLHRPGSTAHYEIKPDSRRGVSEGRRKLALLAALGDAYGLPYREGRGFTPAEELPIGTRSVEGYPIELYLSPRLLQPGLVSYRFCIRGDLDAASRKLAARLRHLALLGLLLGVLVPIGDPVPSPGPSPAPVPADLVVPEPYSGPIDGTFTFHYVRGLSRTAKAGEVHSVVLGYESVPEAPGAPPRRCATVVDFRVASAEKGRFELVSTNRRVLNIAPEGCHPFLILVGNAMSVTWNR